MALNLWYISKTSSYMYNACQTNIKSCVLTAIAVYNYTDVMTTVVLIQTMLLWSEQMTLHVKASQWGWMGEPGATAGAPLTVFNRLDSFAVPVAAEKQACAKQRPRSSLEFTFVSSPNDASINYR